MKKEYKWLLLCLLTLLFVFIWYQLTSDSTQTKSGKGIEVSFNTKKSFDGISLMAAIKNTSTSPISYEASECIPTISIQLSDNFDEAYSYKGTEINYVKHEGACSPAVSHEEWEVKKLAPGSTIYKTIHFKRKIPLKDIATFKVTFKGNTESFTYKGK